MEYSIHENGWVVRVSTPILEMSDTDKQEAFSLLRNNVVLLWKNQKLSPQEELDFCGSIGDYDFKHVDDMWDSLPDDQKDIFIKEYPGILRVTGRSGAAGGPGHFHHKDELKWHSDRIGNPIRKNCVWLYGVSDTRGSVTNLSNGFLAYENLSATDKSFYDSLEVQHYNTRYRSDRDRSSHSFRKSQDEKFKEMDIWHKVVIENDFGRKGFFISPLQVGRISGMSEKESLLWADDLLEYLVQPEFVYSHKWEDGDVLIGEQSFGMHSRDAFDGMDKRYLHHIQFNLNKIAPNLKYKGYNGTL